MINEKHLKRFIASVIHSLSTNDVLDTNLKLLDDIFIEDNTVNINASKLRELLHELKECIGSLINSSETEIRRATDKIEAIFEHDAKAPVDDTTPEVAPEVAPSEVAASDVPAIDAAPIVTSNPTEPTA